MAKRDYYDTLGIHKTADAKAIKQAYRKLAKKYHPDTNPGDKNAEQKFKEVTEAYNVLSDTEKKKMYDQYGFAAFDESMGSGFHGRSQNGYGQGGFGNGTFHRYSSGGFGDGGNYTEYHFEGDDMGDIFGDLFGDAFRGAGTGGFGQSGYGQRSYGRNRTASQKGADIQADITISFEEAALGCEKVFQLQGAGAQNLKVQIPAGIDEGKSIRLKGKGQTGMGGAQNGDLFLRVHVIEKKGYERKGNDVYSTVRVPFTTAALGGEVKVHTIHGDVMCRVPEGTQGGSKIRLRGKGIVSMKNAASYGDHYVTIQIQIPKHLSTEMKEKLREFAKIGKM